MQNKFSILIGGEAGQGVAKTSLSLSKALTQIGYYTFVYRDYPSLIKGGHNFDVVTISNEPVYSQESKYDLILAFNQDTVDKHQKFLKKDGFVLGDKKLRAKNSIGIDINELLDKIKASNKVVGNNILAGYLFKLYSLPLTSLLKSTSDIVGKNKQIKDALKEGYNVCPSLRKFIPSSPIKKKYFLSGSEAVGSGAIASGLDVYIAYPITPATPVLHFLAKRQIKNKFLVLQLENEIGVANAALGASFGGAMTMIGTSGAGLSLMSEAMSMEGMSEIPLVVYLSQRTGPATGIPTYSSQGDLKLVLNIGHGEFPKIVVAPGDPNETFERTIEAFYLAHKYRMLVLLLLDKHLSESYFTFDKINTPKVKPKRFILEKVPKDYKSYQITANGVSPRAVPGQGPVVRATSYEHNEYGYTIEDEKWAVKMNDKRFSKVPYLKKEINKLNPISVYGKGKNLIVGWGSTKGAIVDSLSSLPNCKFLQISYISPFPSDAVKKEIEKSKNVILVENNATGLLGDVVAENTGCIIKNKVLKYDSRPFTADDVTKGVERYLK